jgi:hypothetical protein
MVRGDNVDLPERFRELTLLLYNTSIPLATLDARVAPLLSRDVEFQDPCIMAHGRHKFRIGMRGFHCAFRFRFEIFQLAVRMNQDDSGGRAMVDGVMHLRPLWFYAYPLRTILVYDFVMTKKDPAFLITRLEEMWSLGDLVQHAPLVGPLYQAGRRLSGYLFTGLFFLSCLGKEGGHEQRQGPA